VHNPHRSNNPAARDGTKGQNWYLLAGAVIVMLAVAGIFVYRRGPVVFSAAYADGIRELHYSDDSRCLYVEQSFSVGGFVLENNNNVIWTQPYNGTFLAFTPDSSKALVRLRPPPPTNERSAQEVDLRRGLKIRDFGTSIVFEEGVFTPDGRLFATSGYGDVYLHDYPEGSNTQTILGNFNYPLFFNPAGTTLYIMGIDDRVHALDLATTTVTATIGDPIPHYSYSWPFSRDRIALSNRVRSVSVYTVPAGTLIIRLPPPEDDVMAVAFAPGGDYLAVGTEHQLFVYECRTWKPILVENRPTHALTFSPNGKWLAHAYNKVLTIWDAHRKLDGLTP